jgi:signal transduction histidine kinase/DNA-binding response OmpR family regulator/ligand-binding sensor domain-containing protein
VRVTGAGEELGNDIKKETSLNRSPMPWGSPGPPTKAFHYLIKMVFIIQSLLFIALLLLPAPGNQCLYSQNYGLKYSRNYIPDEYELLPQNWDILEDPNGLIYVANQGGLLEYDGVSWKSIEIPGQTVRSLAIDSRGTIYLGGVNEIGYLAKASQGRLEYTSLTSHLQEDKKNFGIVWRTHVIKDIIFFRTSNYILRWKPQQQQLKVILETKKDQDNTLSASFTCFTCQGMLFVHQLHTGLMRWQSGSFKIIPGSQTFADCQDIFMLAPYNKPGSKIIIGARDKGFFIYDGKSTIHFSTQVDEYLKEKIPVHGIALSKSPGDFAIATRSGGLAIIDSRGQLKHLFTQNYGLYNNDVKYVFEDSLGDLWTALNEGISKIEYLSPLSFFDDYSHLPGMVFAVVRHSKKLYAGTSQGLFYMDENSNQFEPVPGIYSACRSLLSNGDSVIAATSQGVYQVQNNNPREITNIPAYVLLRSRQDPNRIWVGMRGGLASLYIDKSNRFKQENTYDKIYREIKTIVEDTRGHLWLGARGSGVFKISFPDPGNIYDYHVIRYSVIHRLPAEEVQVCQAAKHVMFAARKGLFRFREEKNIFVLDYTLGKEFSTHLQNVFRIVEDKNNSIWVHANGRNFQALLQPGQAYQIIEKPLARVPLSWLVNSIYPDPDQNVTWFATHKGLVRFDPRVKKNYDHEYRTIIRRVLVNGTPQFYDIYPSENTPGPGKSPKQSLPTFQSDKRDFRFEFAAPFFEYEAGIRYSFFLKGYDNKWSEWHKDAFKDYTIFNPGTYTFRVRARNVYGQTGEETGFRFKILPPWYRTWWAYCLYALLVFTIIFFSWNWRSRKLQKEKNRLEKVVEARTKEINLKNQQLEKQTALLIEQAEKLEELDHTKSRFFANISHEFRTPITLIIGPLEQILASQLPHHIKDKMQLMHRNSQRLLKLINQLLDLSRIESGKMKINASPQDIISFLKSIIASFEQACQNKEVILKFHARKEPITLYFDPEKLEEVFSNLLLNALNYTSPTGKITVSVKSNPGKEEDFPEGFVEISIKDTGCGIPKEQLDHIFERFFQVDSQKKKHNGTGIGLALTKELVTLHHGKIDVDSRTGEKSGTEFVLRFPLGKNHLHPDQIDQPKIMTDSQDNKQQEYETENHYQFEEEDTTGNIEPKIKKQQPVKYTVLLVEDNPEMRRFIRASINDYYNVVEAEDGQEGIQEAQNIMPDLIVSDIMMPDTDGIELCQKLKNDINTSHIPIILLTAKASESSVIQGLEAGADDYITKPFNVKMLAARIKNLIQLRHQLQEKIQNQLRLQPEEIKISSIDQRFINQLQNTIEKNLSDFDLNVETMSEKMDISRVTLNKKIYAITGLTATEFIRSYRLQRAMQLLKVNFGSVLDVALEVGFSNPSYFAKCFKEEFHQLPSEFMASENNSKIHHKQKMTIK